MFHGGNSRDAFVFVLTDRHAAGFAAVSQLMIFEAVTFIVSLIRP